MRDLGARLFCSIRCRKLGPGDQNFEKSLAQCGGDFAFLERDHLKTVLTAPMRRLQQKTQVFPLDVKSSARSRLTHSMETAEYTRLLILFLCREGSPLAPLQRPLELVSSTAALLHDIGNPPFGHFGEAVIRRFLTDICSTYSNALTDSEKLCLRCFNGNAQGLRIVHSIQRLNLCLGQLASVIKIPATARELQRRGIDPVNAGVFLSEEDLLTTLREYFPEGTRHPLSLVMELCDDLAYSLADLEDGADKGLVSEGQAYELFTRLSDILGLDLTDFTAGRNAFATDFGRGRSAVFSCAREVLSLSYLTEISDFMLTNFEEFMQKGDLDLSSLKAVQAVKALKEFENHAVYNALEVESLELTGEAYLTYLLKSYGRLLALNPREFKTLLEGSTYADPYLKRLCHRISRRHQEAYKRSAEMHPERELYARIRLIVDYISGMTDTYAGSEYRILKGYT